ncbi:MAG: DMT family transporter [Anaerolineae bacterium]|nr:DMT family transporter [Anaerolineae bacterium]
MNNPEQLLPVVIVGLIGGLAVGIQGPMSGVLSQKLGPVSASVIIHSGGLIASVVLLLILGGEKIGDWQTLPKPYLLAGIFGLILYITLSITLPRIGVANSVALLVAAQLGTALVFDQFGWFGVPVHTIDIPRLIGVGLMIVAAFLISR